MDHSVSSLVMVNTHKWKKTQSLTFLYLISREFALSDFRGARLKPCSHIILYLQSKVEIVKHCKHFPFEQLVSRLPQKLWNEQSHFFFKQNI